MRSLRCWPAAVGLALLAGCDSNPNGPQFPTVPAGTNAPPASTAPAVDKLPPKGTPPRAPVDTG